MSGSARDSAHRYSIFPGHLNQPDANAALLDRYLLPVAAALEHMQTVTLPESLGYYLRQGQPVLDTSALRAVAVGEIVRLMLDNGEFLGVAEILADGRIAPRRLLQ